MGYSAAELKKIKDVKDWWKKQPPERHKGYIDQASTEAIRKGKKILTRNGRRQSDNEVVGPV